MRARPGVSSVCAFGRRAPIVASLLIAATHVAVGVAAPEVAVAQVAPSDEPPPSALDRAIAHAEDADFASALASFEEAESASEIPRAELARLFSHRATVHFALGEVPAMESDLARLLAIMPDAELPASAPPPVREALDRLRGGIAPPSLEVDARPIEGGIEVRARVREGGADLVRGLRAHARIAPDGAWQHGEGGAVAIEAPALARVEWFAHALGPGGVIVASEGSEDHPRAIVVPVPIAAEAPASDDAVWWAIGGSGAAVVIGAIAAGVAIAMTSTTSTTIGGPELVP